jgi:hypothetical protein
MIIAFVTVGLVDPLLLAGKWLWLCAVGALAGLAIAAAPSEEAQPAEALTTVCRWYPAIAMVVAALGFIALQQTPILNGKTLFFASAVAGYSAMLFSFGFLSLLSSLRKAAL